MSVRPAAGGQRGAQRAEADVPAATKEDLNMVRTVCQIVVRQFYQDQHVIFIDILSRHLVIPAEILAKALGVPVREMLQIANQLIRDRLINVFRRSEMRESGPSNFVRPSIRNYVYLDRKVFLDVTKWRIMKMRSQIDTKLRNELDNKGYMCPRCGKAFSTLDVASLLDPDTMITFICDVPGCGNELQDNEDAEDVKRSRDRIKRFNEQCSPITDRLQRLDTVALPHFDLMREIAQKGDTDAWIKRALQRSGTKVSLDDVTFATGGAKAGPSIEIDMISNNPQLEAQRQLEREAEAARKRQENALPAWLQETQDPNARPQTSLREQDESSTQIDRDGQTSTGDTFDVAQDDYYARYASMAQEDEGEDDDLGDLDLEDATGSGTGTGTGTLNSQKSTPQPSSKRSRDEEGDGRETNGKRAAREDSIKVEDDEEEEEEFEDLEEVV